ncbi:restriction endonuclease subunit S [Allomesorhizobium camelthorni]|uniref:Type I restriction modification DNA specificity domain-containing protein n=1 Tax=Allomesorhizobium camelthorni TaxID=475069 RepID=A0A6G4WL21_9HYPH|nr:restriction endonuclease subunit S [Mesorhizobium camelthorni]NGO54916.1 hypothetical protein [Mesorhizobium camelthorni]
MAGEWALTTLGDVTDVLTGFPFKSSSFSEDSDDVKLLRGDNVAQGSLRWDNAKRWPNAAQSDLDSYRLLEGDLILAMDRPWIEAGLKFAVVRPQDLPSLLVQRVARLRARVGVDQRFLGYVIASRSFTDYILGVQTGTAVPHISAGQIRAFSFKLPAAADQKAIGELLGSLDDKIQLNRRIGETLEDMALTLFKNWFVDFGPVRAKAEGRVTGLSAEMSPLFPEGFGADGLPEGWVKRPLLQHARLISGGTPKTDEPAYWNGAVSWASAKDVSQCPDRLLIGTERSITQRGLVESATRIVPALSTVVVARGATTGRHCLFGREMAMNQTCYALSSLNETPFWLTCAFAHLVDELVQGAHGSVFDTITTTTLGAAHVIDGGQALMLAFEASVQPLYQRILGLIEEATTLRTLRDTLLPKLISGELRIKDAEEAVAA